jgi:Carboxypeptidase regulatory-like domain
MTLGALKTFVRLSCLALIACTFARAQSPVGSAPAAQLQTFHVQGTITNNLGEPVFRVRVEFHSKEPNTDKIKVLDTDATGFYQTDLPLGDYTMTGQALGFRPYRRPFFRITAPTRLTFDVTLRDIAACDVLVFSGPGVVTPDEWAASQKESCLREDFLSLSSRGAPFELSFRYGSRTHEHGVYAYDGEKNGTEEIPVFVAYNQFTLQADKAVFDPHKKTIAASGDVLAWNEPDTIQRADAATFRIDNDRVVRVDSPATFHVKGAITDPYDAVVPHMQIKFQSKLFDKTVTANDVGAYEADLDVGEYSMTATNNFLKTRRIQFRAASPTSLTVNGAAYPRRLTCDIVVGGADAANATKDICGGEDSFEIPSDDGTFLHLYVQFEKRKRGDEEYVYRSAKNTSGDLITPVFVDCFSLQADEVTYDLNTRILKASGNVGVTDASGATERFDSASFKIENGRLKPLH